MFTILDYATCFSGESFVASPGIFVRYLSLQFSGAFTFTINTWFARKIQFSASTGLDIHIWPKYSGQICNQDIPIQINQTNIHLSKINFTLSHYVHIAYISMSDILYVKSRNKFMFETHEVSSSWLGYVLQSSTLHNYPRSRSPTWPT